MSRARKDFILGTKESTCVTCDKPFKRPIDGSFCKRAVCIPCIRESRKLAARRDRLKSACKRHGITIEKYEEILARQNGRCAICAEPPAPPSVDSDAAHSPASFLHIDHDHKTGAVRGLLCHHCNVGIGHLRDDVALLNEAIRYLLKEIQ